MAAIGAKAECLLPIPVPLLKGRGLEGYPSNSTVKFIAKIPSNRSLPSGPAARRNPGRLSTALQIAGVICWFMYSPKH